MQKLIRRIVLSALLYLQLVGWEVHGQAAFVLDYDWEEKPVLHTTDSSELDETELILKDKRIITFYYNEEKQLREYNLEHRIIKVNSDKAIKYNNRIYIPFNNFISVVREKARVINSEGKVRELSAEDIKEARDEETNRVLRYFAVEGVDLGSEIEYYYVVEKSAQVTGNVMILQSDKPAKDVSVQIVSPKNLVFATKSYNGLPKMTLDTTLEDVHLLKVHQDVIPKLEPEESATYTPHLMQLIYKLQKDYFRGSYHLTAYDDVAKLIYQNVYGTLSKKTEKKLQKLIKTLHFDPKTDQEELIRSVENYVKSNYLVQDYVVFQAEELEQVLETKISNEFGITKLFANIFRILEIPHQLVLTSDRERLRFDPEFEAYNFLQNYMIYFTKIDQYLAPTRSYFRLGYVPSNWINNHALFLEPLKMEGYLTALPKIKFIHAAAYDQSSDDLFVNVEMGNELDTLHIKMKRSSTGYYAQNTQPFYDLLNEEQKKEVSESIVKSISPDAQIHSISSENEGGNMFGVRPFIIKSELSSSAFIEKAGSKYLFKIGELIGPQIEMYQEGERKLEIENDFARKYHRIIEFNVPDQFEVKNLDKLNLQVAYQSDAGDTLMTFLSTYQVKGDKVKVDVVEYYKKVVYPLALFEEYRKVINAAADFNKIGLVIERKKNQ